MTTFADLGVRPRTATVLERHSIISPNSVQCEAIPPLLDGRDAVIEAPTGSGKTLAFVVPMVEMLQGHRGGGARALVLTPTRELAAQVGAVVKTADPGMHVALLIGGVGYGSQLAALRNAPDVIVACPGRLIDLAGQGVATLGAVRYLVLDEADEMLDHGFARDVERIIEMLPAGSAQAGGRQTVLASATMPEWVQTLIRRHLNDPARIRVIADAEPDLEHGMLRVVHAEKIDILATLLTQQRAAGSQTIVFHRTKHGAKKLARDLVRRGFSAVELQGNLSQNARDRAIGSFRSNDSEVLVATNVAARGIDVGNVGLVINAELPETAQWLTHRIGRTARNGASGRAITFISELDTDQWRKLRLSGAPALPEIDAQGLLAEGGWSLSPVSEDIPTHSRSTSRSTGWRGRSQGSGAATPRRIDVVRGSQPTQGQGGSTDPQARGTSAPARRRRRRSGPRQVASA